MYKQNWSFAVILRDYVSDWGRLSVKDVWKEPLFVAKQTTHNFGYVMMIMV